MALCFIEPHDAIRVIAESVGREARRQLLGELVRAWVDEIPERELDTHYAKAVADLDEHDLSMLAAWHASLEVGQPIANRDFLMNVFPTLGENRREALKIAAGFRGEEAFEAGVAEDDDYARRAAGEVACGTTLDLGRLRLDCAFFTWRMEGRSGVGRYDVLRRVD